MTKHLRFLIVLLMTLVWSAVMFAQKTETITIADYVSTTDNCKEIPVGAPLNQNGFKIYIEKKNTKTNPGLYKSDNTLRFYNTDILHIESSNGDVTSVEFTYLNNNKKYFNIKGLTSNTWSGTPSASLSFTASDSNRLTVIKITYTESSSSNKTPTKVSFDSNSGTTFTFTEGEYSDGTFTAPTATETTGVAGTITYSSNNESAVKVDASTGALSFPGYGEATITATFTPTDAATYAASTDSYKVINNQKVDESVIVFSAEAKSFESIVTGKDGYDGNKGKIDFIATNGKKYTFDVQRALKNNGKLQLNNSTVTSPAFPDFTNGYKVTIEYNSTNESATIDLSSGSVSVNGKYNDKTILLDVQDGSPFKIVVNAKPLYISKIEIVPNNVILDETATNKTIEAKSGVNVTLKRTMKAGVWNTICLPFDVSEDKAKTVFGAGVKIAVLDTKSTDKTLKFDDYTTLGIPAATPCLIKPSEVKTSNEYVFENVNIVADELTYDTTDGNLAFRGIYNMVDVTTDVKNIGDDYYAAFLGANNTIFKANVGGKMKGFRAYFAIPYGTSASALRVVIDGTATSIKNIESEVVESNAPVYNLQGQRVDGNNLTPGIYVKAGKKFVVK